MDVMSLKTRAVDAEVLMMGTSSLASGNAELSMTADKSKNGKKAKRYVKKKGEARKRDSSEAAADSVEKFVPTISGGAIESTETAMDKVANKLGKIVIGEGEMRNPDHELQAANDKGDSKVGKNKEDREKIDKNGTAKPPTDKNIAMKINRTSYETTKKRGKNSSAVKNDESKADGEEPVNEKNIKTENGSQDISRERSELTRKKTKIERGNDKSEEKTRPGFKKSVDKGKTKEEEKKDRQTARFAKAVAKFSMKFAEAAKELGLVRPNEDSSSWSDTSGSSWTDTSSSSSCSCSDCCTTDSSSCSCSDCCSDKCSTCSPSDSELESSDTSDCSTSSLTSSEASCSNPKRKSTSRIALPD